MKHKEKATKTKNRIFPLIGAIIVFVLCFSILYAYENVGLSDNGDFRRVLLVNNLEYKDETNHYYLFKQDYTMEIQGDTTGEKLKSLWRNNEYEEIYTSPHFVLIKISKTLNYFVNIMSATSETAYNIMYLALIYIFMLSIAAWGIFTFFAEYKKSTQVSVFLIFVFIFCDVGYILYFNSFYGEPLQYVAFMMLISVGLLIYRRPSIPKVVCFFISLYFFAGAKLANIPYSIMVCVLSLTFLVLRGDKRFRIGVLVSLVATAGCIIQLYSSIPDWMHNDTTYQSVFFGIVKESDTPEEDLEFLGVDKKYASLMNTHAYMDKEEYVVDIMSEEFKMDFYDRVSKTDIALFYMLHPVRLIKKLNIAIENSAYIRPPGTGNSMTVPMDMTNRFSLWTHIRSMIKFPYNPMVIFVGFLLITAYTVIVDIFYYKRRYKEPKKNIYMMASVNVLVLGLWINLILPIVGNGEADIAKHMFLFVNCIDILIAVVILSLFNMKPRNLILSAVTFSLLIICCNYKTPKQYMTFGTYNNTPVVWEIYETLNDGTEILVTKDAVIKAPFDLDDNSWEESDIRAWLNNEFLLEFSEEELSKLVKSTNAIIVPTERKGRAIAGDHTHYWNFTKERANNLSKTAYHYYLDDYVYIPTLDMLDKMGGYEEYWVLCPYGNNTTMERFVNNDGFVLHTTVNNKKGVRAVIRYKAGKNTGE